MGAQRVIRGCTRKVDPLTSTLSDHLIHWNLYSDPPLIPLPTAEHVTEKNSKPSATLSTAVSDGSRYFVHPALSAQELISRIGRDKDHRKPNIYPPPYPPFTPPYHPERPPRRSDRRMYKPHGTIKQRWFHSV